MIPKRIFQTAKEPLPLDTYNKLRPHICGWKYEFYDDNQILCFFKKHPSEEFPNLIERFHEFHHGQHKADLFRYYYLWLYGGVFLDSDAMIYAPIDMITQDYSFITAKPHKIIALNRLNDTFNDTIFNGFIGSIPKHPAIYQALYKVCTTPIEEINQDYSIFCKQLYFIIYEKSYPDPKVYKYMEEHKYRIYEEYSGRCKPYSLIQINEDDFYSPVILAHFFDSKTIDDENLKYNFSYKLSSVPTMNLHSSVQNLNSKIPKIIHQLWIGPHPCPVEIMNTWKTKHPDYEYILWNERLINEEFNLSDPDKCNLLSIDAYNNMNELVGKVDILRWEILFRYGGIFIDADSICLERIPDNPFLNCSAFATFENEIVRTGLIAIGTMGFIPKHPLLLDIIEKLLLPETMELIKNYKAWFAVGPSLLTRLLDTKKYVNQITIFPSYMFLPYHFTGEKYHGYKKIYAYQEWANTKNASNILYDVKLPEEFQPNYFKILQDMGSCVSILMTSYNANQRFLRDSFNSIRNQIYINSPIGLEIVVIDDCSDQEHRRILEKELEFFINNTNKYLVKVIYKRLEVNVGVGGALRVGVETCTNELIAIQDTDDIMFPHRIITQYDYMMKNPNIAMCSSAVETFKDEGANMKIVNGTIPKHKLTKVKHAPVLRKSNVNREVEWITNQVTMMIRKSQIMNVGNYRIGEGPTKYREDRDLIQRILDADGEIHNLEQVLGYYRLHNKQTSLNLRSNT